MAPTTTHHSSIPNPRHQCFVYDTDTHCLNTGEDSKRAARREPESGRKDNAGKLGNMVKRAKKISSSKRRQLMVPIALAPKGRVFRSPWGQKTKPAPSKAKQRYYLMQTTEVEKLRHRPRSTSWATATALRRADLWTAIQLTQAHRVTDTFCRGTQRIGESTAGTANSIRQTLNTKVPNSWTEIVEPHRGESISVDAADSPLCFWAGQTVVSIGGVATDLPGYNQLSKCFPWSWNIW